MRRMMKKKDIEARLRYIESYLQQVDEHEVNVSDWTLGYLTGKRTELRAILGHIPPQDAEIDFLKKPLEASE